MIDTSLFPYTTFPVRLEQKNENKVCWFKDEIDLEKYLVRSKIDRRTIQIDKLNEQSIESSKTNKTKIRQRTGKNNNGSSSRSAGSKKRVDSNGTTSRTRKPK